MKITQKNLGQFEIAPNQNAIFIAVTLTELEENKDKIEVQAVGRIQVQGKGLAKIFELLFEDAKSAKIAEQVLARKRQRHPLEILKEIMGQEFFKTQEKSTTMEINPNDPVAPKKHHEDVFGGPTSEKEEESIEKNSSQEDFQGN